MALTEESQQLGKVKATLFSRHGTLEARHQLLRRHLQAFDNPALCAQLLNLAIEAVKQGVSPMLAEVVLEAVLFCRNETAAEVFTMEKAKELLSIEVATKQTITFFEAVLRRVPGLAVGGAVRAAVLQLLIKVNPGDQCFLNVLSLVGNCPEAAAAQPFILRAVGWISTLKEETPENESLSEIIACMIAARWRTPTGEVDQAMMVLALNKVVDQLNKKCEISPSSSTSSTLPPSPYFYKVLVRVPQDHLSSCMRLLAPMNYQPYQLSQIGKQLLGRYPAIPAMEPWMLGLLRALDEAQQTLLLQGIIFLTAEALLNQAAAGAKTFSTAMRILELELCGLQGSPRAFFKLLPKFKEHLRARYTLSQGPHLVMLQKRLVNLCHVLMHLHPGYSAAYKDLSQLLPPDSCPSEAAMQKFIQENTLRSLTKEAFAQAQSRAAAAAVLAEEADPEPKMPVEKPYQGITGLQNTGQTCYMNAYLQALFMTDAFRSFVIDPVLFMERHHSEPQPDPEQQTDAGSSSMVLDEDESFSTNCIASSSSSSSSSSPALPKDASAASSSSSVPSPPWSPLKTHRDGSTQAELSRLFCILLTTSHSSYVPTRFSHTLPPHFRSSIQQDSSEFGKFLLDRLEEDMDLAKVSPNPIHLIFGGQTITTTLCLHCRALSCRTEPFLDLSLAVPPSATAQDIPHILDLLQDYLSPEELCQDNQYECDSCNGKRDAQRWTEIADFPDHLVITLSRFRYDIKARQRLKISTPVECPLAMKLPPKKDAMDGPLYELYAIIIHSGFSAQNGHYYCVGRRSTSCASGSTASPKQKQWFLLNDAATSPTDVNEHISVGRQQSSTAVPYILFYRRTDHLGDKHLPEDCMDSVSPRVRDMVEAEDRVHFQQLWQAWSARHKKRQALLPAPPPLSQYDDTNPFGDGSQWGTV